MGKNLTPIKAIRAKCLDCACGVPKEVRLCPIPDCPLYPYRFGHRPKGDGNIEEDNTIKKNADSTAIFERKMEADG